jgi:hypothetical protein
MIAGHRRHPYARTREAAEGMAPSRGRLPLLHWSASSTKATASSRSRFHAPCPWACSGTALSRETRPVACAAGLPHQTPPITWHQATRWPSLISPRYNTCRCTTLPPTLVLDNISVATFFAVLEASIESQEHDATLGERLRLARHAARGCAVARVGGTFPKGISIGDEFGRRLAAVSPSLHDHVAALWRIRSGMGRPG